MGKEKMVIGKGDVGEVPAEVLKSTKTPEQLKAAEVKKAERAEARKRVLSFVKANEEQLDRIADDIRLFVGRERAARAPKASINSALRAALLEAHSRGESLSEMDVFKAFKIGRPEMVGKTRILVLCPNPADRVWVSFDEEAEVYNVVGLGANPPKGWDGYVPATKETL